MEKSRTEEGRKEVKQYILQARMAYGVQIMFEALNIIPDVRDQHKACQMMYDCLFRVPIEQVMDWAQSCAEGLSKQEKIGNC